ncbi:MAG: DUF3820 family protein [Bacteroidetes bacterium]|nr:DUF3820 family protein [Bacteroidota bacterium]
MERIPFGDPNLLLDLVKTEMPFGKYKGRLLCDLPDHYLEFFAREGFPKGKLGMQMATMHEIALNGLRDLLLPLRGKK